MASRVSSGLLLLSVLVAVRALIPSFYETSAPFVPGITSWTSVASDGSGQLLAAVSNNGGSIYTSANAGQTWVAVSSPAESWKTISSDSTGQHLFAGSELEGLFVSTNYGQSWTQATVTGADASSLIWTSIDVSQSGQYVSATAVSLSSTTGAVFTSSDYGQQFALTYSFPSPTTGVTSDATGQYVYVATAASGVFYSSDFGLSFVNQTVMLDGPQWTTIATNYNATVVAVGASPGHLYVSPDSGVTYVETSAPYALWTSVASDYTGQYIMAVTGPGEVYVSSTFGVHWDIVPAPLQNWTSIASADSGPQFVAVATGAGVYSTSAEAMLQYSFTQQNPLSAGSQNWQGVVCSASGQSLAAIINPGSIVISTDYGSTWAFTAAPGGAKWSAITTAADSNGIVYAATVSNGGIYLSTSGGGVWNPTPATTQSWSCIAMSGSGQYIYAGTAGAKVYYSSQMGSVWLTSSLASSTWSSIATSSSGKLVLAGSVSGIWVNNAFGASTWKLTNAPPQNYKGISLDATGTYVVAVPSTGVIHFGVVTAGSVAWAVSSSLSLQWTAVAASSTGQYVAASTSASGVYVSSNYGADWTLQTSLANLNFIGIDISSSGLFVTAVVHGGSLYTSMLALSSSPTAAPTFIAPTPAPTSLRSPSSKKLPEGAIYGIIAGSVVAAAVLVGVVYSFVLPKAVASAATTGDAGTSTDATLNPVAGSSFSSVNGL